MFANMIQGTLSRFQKEQQQVHQETEKKRKDIQEKIKQKEEEANDTLNEKQLNSLKKEKEDLELELEEILKILDKDQDKLLNLVFKRKCPTAWMLKLL